MAFSRSISLRCVLCHWPLALHFDTTIAILERSIGRFDVPIQPLHPCKRIFNAQSSSVDLSGWSHLHRRHRVCHTIPAQPLTHLTTSSALKRAVLSAQLQRRVLPCSSQTPHPVVPPSKAKTRIGTLGPALASTSTQPIHLMRRTTICSHTSLRSCRKSLLRTNWEFRLTGPDRACSATRWEATVP